MEPDFDQTLKIAGETTTFPVVGRLIQLILAVTKYELNKIMLLTKDY